MEKTLIFSTQPFEKPNSYKFLKAAKDGDTQMIKQLIKSNKYLVYDFDHV